MYKIGRSTHRDGLDYDWRTGFCVRGHSCPRAPGVLRDIVKNPFTVSRTRVSAQQNTLFSDNLSSRRSNSYGTSEDPFPYRSQDPKDLVIVGLLEEAFMEVGKNNHDGMHAIDAQAIAFRAAGREAAHEEFSS